MRIYLLVGDANTRKSSATRALTGAPGTNKDHRLLDVQFSGGRELAHVRTGALQESHITVVEAVAELSASNASVAIFPLRDVGINGCEDASKYIAAFQLQGWTVNVAVMQQRMRGQVSTIPVVLSSAKNDPTNKSAAKLRQAWQID